MKRCTKCDEDKDDKCFSKGRGGLRSHCKECVKKVSAIYYLKNKGHINEKTKEYWSNNKEELNKWQKQYYNTHKEDKHQYLLSNKDILACKRRCRENARLKIDIAFRLRKNIARSIRRAIKDQNSRKDGSCTEKLGYSFQELKEHLEQQFEPWMTWDNWGEYDPKVWDDNDPTIWKWQIDHIVPHSTFRYVSMDDESFKKCWALKNLRPLSAKLNLLDGIRKVRHHTKAMA